MDETDFRFGFSSDSALKATAFAHFTYEYGRGELMVTDLQGNLVLQLNVKINFLN